MLSPLLPILEKFMNSIFLTLSLTRKNTMKKAWLRKEEMPPQNLKRYKKLVQILELMWKLSVLYLRAQTKLVTKFTKLYKTNTNQWLHNINNMGKKLLVRRRLPP